MNSTQIGLIFASVTAISWGVLAIALKYALQFASAGSIVWARMSIAFILLLSWQAFYRPEALVIFKRPPLLAILASLMLAFNYFGYMKGVELTSASNAQIMIQMAPTFLAFIGFFYFKESPKPIQVIGYILTFTGFACFYKDQVGLATDNADSLILGNTWIFAGAITWALYATFQKILTQKWAAQQINLILFGLASLVLLPMADLKDFLQLNLWQFSIMLFLGINSVVAYGALGEALKRAPASLVSLIIILNPLITISLASLMTAYSVSWFQPEPIQILGLIGAFLVIIGVVIAVLGSKASTKE